MQKNILETIHLNMQLYFFYFSSSALGMYVYDIVDNVYHVDIFKNNIEKQVSVRESLLWMGLGSFTTAKSLRVF